MAEINQLLEDLILANHILHYHDVVDAFGHISVRHPTHPWRFIMSANMAPALVRSVSDFVEYNIEDARPAQGQTAKGFVERYIHSELYKKYPKVTCVVHAHADDVLPYTVSGVRFRAMSHMAGFLGFNPGPLFDIELFYQKGDPKGDHKGDAHDLLVNNTRLGKDLASYFSWAGHEGDLPERALILMRKHGFTTWGRSIKEAVYRAVYATKNAKLQTTSTLLRGAFDADPKNAVKGFSHGEATGPIHHFEALTKEQARDAEAANLRAVERPWGLWVQEVKCQALYTRIVDQR